MSKELRLQVILAAIDKATGPIRKVMGSSGDLAKSVKAARDQLKGLEQANARMDAFRQTSRDLAVTGNALQQATARVAQLKQEMAAAEAPTKAQSRALQEAIRTAGQLKERNQALAEKQQRLRTELERSGTPTRELARHQKELQGKIKTATAALAEQEKALKKHGATMKKMAAARGAYDKAMERRATLAGTGAGMVATGGAMGAPVIGAVRDYSAFEDAMLGVARQVEGARNDAGQLTPLYYEMGEAIKSMAERIPMATTEIAALIEAGARMGIQGKENLLAFAETTAITATAFDLPVDQVGEDMAKLAQLYKVPIANIASLGDTINWLDDNALSKGGDIIDVMKRIAGTADSVGMKYQEAAALGSAFLSLGAGAEVAASASNAMMRELSVATMQSKRFQEGLGMLKLDAGQIQLGMSQDSTGTILKVLEAIRALPQEKQLEATTRLFGKEFGDDAAKLAGNLDEYRRQLKMVHDEESRGSMQREAAARMQNLSAQYELAKNSVFNLSSELGSSLKPALIEIMQGTSRVLSGVRDWVKENPQLAATLMKTLAVVAMIVTVLGGLALAAAAVIGPIAMLRYGFAMLSIGGAGPLSMLMTLGRTILPMVGNAILFIGRALMMNPIGLIITAIAVAAFLIYKYWGPISTFFTGLWTNITTFARTAWGSLISWFTSLPSQMLTIGGQIIDGLWQGLAAKWEGLKAKVAEIADSVAGAVKGALGIHSPSRVFAELGGYTMQGLQMGLQAAAAGPLGVVTQLAGNLATAGAVALGATMPALAVDNRPPINAAQAGAQATGAVPGGSLAGASIQIIVQPSPGMDEAKLAELVARKVEELQRKTAAAGRGRLTDYD